MIPVSKLVAGSGTVSERLGVRRPRSSGWRPPIVFWNLTWNCNLKCVHCYINAVPGGRPGELSREEALSIAMQLVEARVPLVVLSGGEPLLRPDIWDVIEALEGVRVGLSSNGTLVTRKVAENLAAAGISYVGVSLDSADPRVHDKIRGVKGAFERALEGAINARDAGLDVGLRVTVMKGNMDDALGVLRIAEEHGFPRVAVYLVDSVGRARLDPGLLPSRDEVRRLVDKLAEEARRLAGKVEIILVRASFAGVYLALKAARGDEEKLRKMLTLIPEAGCGARSVSIYPDGTVRPCQFIEHVVLGSLRRARFAEIVNPENPRLRPFLEPWRLLRGPRCSRCRFKEYCGGGSRGRALAATGDFWGDDPLCFLNDDEIGVN